MSIYTKYLRAKNKPSLKLKSSNFAYSSKFVTTDKDHITVPMTKIMAINKENIILNFDGFTKVNAIDGMQIPIAGKYHIYMAS